LNLDLHLYPAKLSLIIFDKVLAFVFPLEQTSFQKMIFALNSVNQTVALNFKDSFNILYNVMNLWKDISCAGKEGMKPNNFHMFCFSDGFKRERNCLKGATNLDTILAVIRDSS
jgi:hypothetical protein